MTSKWDVESPEGRDAIRDLLRVVRGGGRAVETQFVADGPGVIDDLLNALERAEASMHGRLGVDLRDALYEHLFEVPSGRTAQLAEGVKVETLSVGLLPGRAVVDVRLVASQYVTLSADGNLPSRVSVTGMRDGMDYVFVLGGDGAYHFGGRAR